MRKRWSRRRRVRGREEIQIREKRSRKKKIEMNNKKTCKYRRDPENSHHYKI
jgi:hypothetical protein